MAIETHVLDANHKLLAHRDQLTSLVSQAARRAGQLLDADGIDISISPFGPGDAPASGIGGYSASPYRVELLLDSERENLADVIQSEVPAVLGHEMHHCIRARHSAHPVTLADCMATEGLATHFELQMNGGVEPSLFREFADVDWRDLLELARPLLNEKAFSFEDWFLGGDTERLPRYAGYLVGFMAVTRYQCSTNCSDLDMIALTTDELFQDL